MKNFKELEIWQKGFEIAVETYMLTNTFPSPEKIRISSQITRAAVSIPSNVVQGSSRKSDKDYHRFIEISLGSSFELETQLLIAKAVELGNEANCNSVLSKVPDEQKMLSSFMNSLKH